MRFYGFIKIEEPGNYIFETCSDDGFNFYVVKYESMVKVLDNDGTHGLRCVSGEIELEEGYQPAIVDYFEGTATNIQLQLYWTRAISTKTNINKEYIALFSG